MKKLKHAISVILVTMLMVSTSMVYPNAAEQNNNITPNDIVNNTVTVEGNSTVGNMISDEFNAAQQSTEESEAKSYGISKATVADKTVSVEYFAAEDCTVIAAIFDENTNQMIASCKTDVTTENDSVDVQLAIDTMPKAFVLKAYMVDSSNSPLSDEYETSMYTTEMQELLAKTVDDFDSEKVLNLDENDSTNFAVYSEDVKILDDDSEKNVLKSYDESTKTYVFENCTDDMLSLKTDDEFSCNADDDNVVIIKVKDISINGDTVTITAQDIEMEDVFDYVKIEAESSLGDAEVDKDSLSPGVTVKENMPQTQKSLGRKVNIDASGKLSKTINLKSDEADANSDEGNKKLKVKGEFDLNGSIVLSGSINFDIYISRKHKECSFSVSVGVGCEFTLKMSGSVDWQIFSIEKALLPKMASVKINFGLILKGEFEAGFKSNITTMAGFKYVVGKGFTNISQPPHSESSLEAEADLFFGFYIEAVGEVIDDNIAGVSLRASGGFQIEATMSDEHLNSNSKSNLNVEHKCSKCISGSLTPTVKIEPKVVLMYKNALNDNLEVGITISGNSKDFYYSFDNKKFDWGSCPNIVYNVPIKVIDENGSSVADADISEYLSIQTILGNSNLNGYFYCALKGGNNGVYQVWVTSGEKKSVLNFSLKGDSTETMLVKENGSFVKIEKSKHFNDGYYEVVIGEDYNSDEEQVTTEPTQPTPNDEKDYLPFISTMTVVGNGEDHWLNDEWWDVTAESNSMNEIAKRVYEITYHNIPKNNNYIVKFVANHSYVDHWGSATDEFIAESGVEFNSAYFGEYIRFNVPYDCADVTLKLDLTNFNYSSKLGAVAKVTVTDTTNNDNPAIENISVQSLSRAVAAVDSLQTADLNGLVPNENYIIASVKSADEKDMLSDDNLLYITQTTADENGCVSLNYLPKEETENSVIVYYGANIKNAEVTIEPIYYNENEQQADYSVSYGGKVLTKDVDYTISIDENVTELGNYSVKITGIGGYCGTKYVTFSVALKAGDVDCDGFVDINDVTALQTYLSQIDNMSYYQKNSSDVTKDNVIDINDATMIQRYCAELCMIS
ncbi:dockerin type I repeat-containing protein [Ruminococcus sp.]